MTLRGTFRDGVVYLTGGGEGASLRNGERVEVTPIRDARTSRVTRARDASKARAKRATKAERLAAFDAGAGIALRSPRRKAAIKKTADKTIPGFGAWKHRTDIKDSAEYARELRRRTSRRARSA